MKENMQELEPGAVAFRISRNIVRLYEFLAYEMQYQGADIVISYGMYTQHRKKLQSGNFKTARRRNDKYRQIVENLNQHALPSGYSVREAHLTLPAERFENEVIEQVRRRMLSRSGQSINLSLFSPSKDRYRWDEFYDANKDKAFLIYSLSAFVDRYLVSTMRVVGKTAHGIQISVRQVFAESDRPEKTGGVIETGEFSGVLVPKKRRCFMLWERENNEEGDISFAVFDYHFPLIATMNGLPHAEGWQTYEATDFVGRKITGSRPIYILESSIRDIDENTAYIGKEIGLMKRIAFTKTDKKGNIIYDTDSLGNIKYKEFIEASLKNMKPRLVTWEG